jgi:hypothetical protein
MTTATDACCDAGSVPEALRPLLARIHPEVLSRYYGCGLVVPPLLEGLRVLELGCGSGGEFFFADVYADRRVPEALRHDPVLYGERLSGALDCNEFVRLSLPCRRRHLPSRAPAVAAADPQRGMSKRLHSCTC